MENLEQFINEIDILKKQLISLEYKFIESYKEYAGNEFDEQNRCAAEIENLILLLTHELSSQIAFGIFDLKTLIKYIDYRKRHHEYTDAELLSLIDKKNDLNIVQRTEITKDKKEKDIHKIVSDWNTSFENNSYDKIKEKLRLKMP